MMTLLRFAWRELRRAKMRIALIAVILTVQTVALGGGYITEASLYFTRDTWSEKLHLADLDVRFTPAAADEMPSLDTVRQVPGVSAVARRFITLGNVEKTDGARLPVLVEYIEPSHRPAVNDIELLDGRWLEKGEPSLALIDRSFAEAHALGIGDEIVVNPRRLTSKFTVAGVGLSAEHLLPTADPDTFFPRKGSLGVIYASREALDRAFPDELYNDILVSFTKDADPRRTTDAVLAVLTSAASSTGGKRPLEIERVVPKKSTFGYRFVNVALSGSSSVTPTITVLIALMASIVAFIAMHRLVGERRREIGCLLALGYSPRALAACFLTIGLVPGIVGGLVGVPSAMVFAAGLTSRVARISGLPKPLMVWEPRWLAFAAGAAVLVGWLSALLPVLGVLRMCPSQALRGSSELRFAGLPGPLEWLVSGSTSIRYAVRNVFRRARLTLATAILVSLGVALPAGLLTSVSSGETWAKGQAARLGFDSVASFKVPLSKTQADDILADKGVASWAGYVQGFASARREDGSVEEMRIRGVPPESELDVFHLTTGRPFSSEDADEAILYTGYSDGKPPRVGEVVTLLRSGSSHRLVVVGLLTDATLSTIIVPRKTAQRLFGLEGKVSGAYLRYGQSPAAKSARGATAEGTPSGSRTTSADVLEKIDLDETAVSAAPAPSVRHGADPKELLLESDLITSVQGSDEFTEATLSFLASLDAIVAPFIGLGSVLSFFFLLSVLGFLLLERETEYATLRSMGYGTAEIATIVLTEVGVLAMGGLMLSIATWAVTAYALRAPMSKAWFWVPMDLRPADYLACALPTVLVLVFAALPGIRALMRLNLASTLRGRAIG
jgi:ABC-type antimicrobial peptide transport system permease subunit